MPSGPLFSRVSATAIAVGPARILVHGSGVGSRGGSSQVSTSTTATMWAALIEQVARSGPEDLRTGKCPQGKLSLRKGTTSSTSSQTMPLGPCRTALMASITSTCLVSSKAPKRPGSERIRSVNQQGSNSRAVPCHYSGCSSGMGERPSDLITKTPDGHGGPIRVGKRRCSTTTQCPRIDLRPQRPPPISGGVGGQRLYSTP